MNIETKIRFLAEQAGWTYEDNSALWRHRIHGWALRPDYEHSLDAITRDLLPLLREKGWEHEMYWSSVGYVFKVWGPMSTWPQPVGYGKHRAEPARAVFEAIYEAFKGGEE